MHHTYLFLRRQDKRSQRFLNRQHSGTSLGQLNYLCILCLSDFSPRGLVSFEFDRQEDLIGPTESKCPMLHTFGGSSTVDDK